RLRRAPDMALQVPAREELVGLAAGAQAIVVLAAVGRLVQHVADRAAVPRAAAPRGNPLLVQPHGDRMAGKSLGRPLKDAPHDPRLLFQHLQRAGPLVVLRQRQSHGLRDQAIAVAGPPYRLDAAPGGLLPLAAHGALADQVALILAEPAHDPSLEVAGGVLL